MKKGLLTGILIVLLLTILAGCGTSPSPSAAATTAPAAAATTAAATATDEPAEEVEPAIDISKEVGLTMYLLGDVPADQEKVYTEFNKLLKERINATLKTNYLSWGDWNTKYSLILASGEDVDLMYTADWAYLSDESAKGAFLELTEDFMNTYLPMTVASQAPASLKQATIDGKLFAIPKNSAGLEGENWIVVRQDLLDKYGMEIKNIDDLEAYFIAVLENESGILPYAASAGGGFGSLAWRQPQQITYLTNLDFAYTYPGNNNPPAFSEIGYAYFREDAIPYYELMKKWADLGFWSKNAISNTEQVRDAFENGKSASLTWNATIFRAGENLEKNNAEWKAGYYDINPGTGRRQALYTNDCIAIAAASKNPERAGMFIDLVKNDREIYLALIGGIEGEHYVLNADGSRTKGPNAEQYPWNPSTWCFNLNDEMGFPEADASQIEKAFLDAQQPLIVAPDTMAFRFNKEPVKNELAAIDALRDEFRPMLELGMVADIPATVADWQSKAEAAGLNRVMEEMEKQYAAWLATM